MGFADLLPTLTLEETLNLNQHRVFRAVLRLLLQEINATRAFDTALATDVFLEINRRRAFDAAIVGDLLQRVNELRVFDAAIVADLLQRINELRARVASDPPLLPLTEADLVAQAPLQMTPADLAAKAPQQAIPNDFTAKPRPQLTVAQVLDVVKALL